MLSFTDAYRSIRVSPDWCLLYGCLVAGLCYGSPKTLSWSCPCNVVARGLKVGMATSAVGRFVHQARRRIYREGFVYTRTALFVLFTHSLRF